MKINNLLKMFMGALVMTFIISSCADDFTEEDLLQAQYDLQQQQQDRADAREDSIDNANRQATVDALNAAGELVSLSVSVVNLDGSPAEGVDVALSSGGETLEATSDASGFALFESVSIGSNTLRLAGTSIYDALLTLDFGQLNNYYDIINGQIVPTNSDQSIVVSVINTDAATATITGNVAIETNLTNTTPEVPQDLTLFANVTGGVSGTQTNSGSVSVNNYQFSTGTGNGVGVAQVDNSTGEFSMTVPAGIQVTLNVPDITTDQTVAVNSVNNVVLERPEVRTISTNFGPNNTADAVPNVPGARAVFSQPASSGQGFTLANWTKVPRGSADGNSYRPVVTFNLTSPSSTDNSVIRFSTLGAGYENSPAVTVTDPTADTTVYAEAWIEISTISEATLAEDLTGFGANADVDFDLDYDAVTQAGSTQSTDTTFDLTERNTVITITANADGEITQTEVDAAIAEALDAGDDYFGGPLFTIGNNESVANLRLRERFNFVDPALIPITVADGRLTAFRVTNGDDYTNPSFTFTGGGASTQAALEVEQFATLWSFDLENPTDSDYTLLPSIAYEYKTAAVSPSLNTDSDFDILRGDNVEVNNVVLNNTYLTIREGDVEFIDEERSARTDQYSTEEPTALITNQTNTPIAYDFDFNGVFENYLDIADISTNDGSISGNPFNNGNLSNESGYVERPTVTIESSVADGPGSGAEILLTGINQNANGEFFWNGGVNIVNPGSGYVRNINQFSLTGGATAYSGQGPVLNGQTLNEGQTTSVNIYYGTGNKTVNVQ